MERKLRYCAVCGTGYKFCPKCNEDKDKPLYHYTFCSKNCKDIYSVISDYRDGELSCDEANKLLSSLDLSKINNFGESYKKSLEEIYNLIAKKNENFAEDNSISDCIIEDLGITKNQTKICETENNEKVLKRSKRAKNDVE